MAGVPWPCGLVASFWDPGLSLISGLSDSVVLMIQLKPVMKILFAKQPFMSRQGRIPTSPI